MNISSIKEIREKYQYSPSDTWYARMVCRKFSVYFTWFFLRTPIIPNQITFLMILSGIIGGIFLGIKGHITGLIGVLFLQLFLILDCVDGEVARCKKKFSSKGKFLDLVANDIVFISIFSGLTSRVFSNNYEIFDFSLFHNPFVIISGISAIIFFLLSKLSSYHAKEVDERISGNFLKSGRINIKIKSTILRMVYNLSSPPPIIVIVTVGAVFNLFSYILFFYGIFFLMYYLASLGVKLKSNGVE